MSHTASRSLKSCAPQLGIAPCVDVHARLRSQAPLRGADVHFNSPRMQSQTICCLRSDNLDSCERMTRRSPSLLALRAFETAARRLSFTEAARELHISQAAVSRHVRALERDVGCELFRRLHRAVELTDSGRRFAHELSGAFLQISRAVEVVRGTRTHRLRITAEPAFASRWMVPHLGDFSLTHPQVELEVETSDEFRLIGRDADLAIRYISVGAPRPRGRAMKSWAPTGEQVLRSSACSSRGLRPRVVKSVVIAGQRLRRAGGSPRLAVLLEPERRSAMA